MRRFTLLALAVLFMFGTAQARSNLIRDVGFENGLERLHVDADSPGDVRITSSVSRSGGKSLRINRPSGRNRAEISDRIPFRAPLHKETWYGWSLRVDKNENPGRIIVSQIHHHQAENRHNQWSKTANFLIRHDAGKRKFTLKHGYQSRPRVRKDNYRDLCTANYGKWHDFVVQVKWTWRSNGYLRIWCDGKRVYEHEGSTYFDYGQEKTKGPYWKAGIYTERRAALVHVDAYRVGNEKAKYADVDPAGKDAPEPPPAPGPLPELRVVGLTWGKTGDNHVGIELAPVDPDADAQLDKRTYKPGSVSFFTLDSDGVKRLTIHRQEQATEGRPQGWTFFLDKPVPQSDIRMVTEKGWLQGGPEIDTTIPRWGDPIPEPATTMDAVIRIEQQK